jgi:hypothetical protein
VNGNRVVEPVNHSLSGAKEQAASIIGTPVKDLSFRIIG